MKIPRILRNVLTTVALSGILAGTVQASDNEKIVRDTKRQLAEEFYQKTGKRLIIDDVPVVELEPITVTADRIFIPEVKIDEKESDHGDFGRNVSYFSNVLTPRNDRMGERPDTFTPKLDGWSFPVMVNGSKVAVPSNGPFNFKLLKQGDLESSSIGTIGEIEVIPPGDRVKQIKFTGDVYLGTIDAGTNLELISGNFFTRSSLRKDNSRLYSQVVKGLEKVFPQQTDVFQEVGWRDGEFVSGLRFFKTIGNLRLDETLRGLDYLDQSSSATLLSGNFGTNPNRGSYNMFRFHVGQTYFNLNSGNFNENEKEDSAVINLNQYRSGIEFISDTSSRRIILGVSNDVASQKTKIKDLEDVNFQDVNDFINPELADTNVRLRELRPYLVVSVPARIGRNDFRFGVRGDLNIQTGNVERFIDTEESESSGALGANVSVSRNLNSSTSINVSAGKYSSYVLIPANLTIHQLKRIRNNLGHDSSFQVYAGLQHRFSSELTALLEADFQRFSLFDGNHLDNAQYSGISLGLELKTSGLEGDVTTRVGKFTENGYPSATDQRVTNVSRLSLGLVNGVKLVGWFKFGSGIYYTPVFPYDIQVNEFNINESGVVLGRYRSERSRPNISYSLGLEKKIGKLETKLGFIHSNRIIGTQMIDKTPKFVQEEPNLIEVEFKYKF